MAQVKKMGNKRLPEQMSDERRAEIQALVANPSPMDSPVVRTLAGDTEQAVAGLVAPDKEELVDRDLVDPAPDEWNFFSAPDDESYNMLMSSIVCEGLMNPVTLWKRPDGRYMILSGHTRCMVYDELYQATNDERWKRIAAKCYGVGDLTEYDARRIIIVANMAQRAKDAPKIRIKCFGELGKLIKAQSPYGSGVNVNAEVAKTFKVSVPTVYFYRKLSRLIEPLLDRLCESKLNKAIAGVLADLPTRLQQYIVDKGYVNGIKRFHLDMLKMAKTKDDIDSIFIQKTGVRVARKFTIELPLESRKDATIIGFAAPKKVADQCRKVVVDAIQKAEIPEDVRNYILAQFIR